jgi:hypothetical protein
MATYDLELPTGETVGFVFLRKYPNLDHMIYLQGVRSGGLDDTSLVAQAYKNMAPIYAGQLAGVVGNLEPRFDAVVAPPSKRSDIDVYRNAVVERTGARDLTSGFSRKGKASAATASSLNEMIEEFDYAALGGESEIKSLLIVDESVASGKTYAAVLHHLREAGLMRDCKITVAAAAWLTESKQTSIT